MRQIWRSFLLLLGLSFASRPQHSKSAKTTMILNTLFAIVIFCSVCFSLNATAKVEIVANFEINPQAISASLKKHGQDAEVLSSDLNQYELLKIGKSKWSKWHKRLLTEVFHPEVLDKDTSKVVFFNITGKYRNYFALKMLPKEKMVLFMWEPPSIMKKMYSEKVWSCFAKIYTWDDSLVDNKTFFKFYYPVWQPLTANIPSFEEKKLCTLVSSNRTCRHPNELYSERLKAIEYFEKAGETGFKFYGRGWDEKEHPNYLGPIGNKVAVIKNYRFSICYENIHDIQGYITEKIFDCFAAGNVPVYWGASNIEQYVPMDCFIDRRNFGSLEELHAFLKKMTKQEYEGYLTRIQAFLDSDQAKLFSYENYEKILSEAIAN